MFKVNAGMLSDIRDKNSIICKVFIIDHRTVMAAPESTPPATPRTRAEVVPILAVCVIVFVAMVEALF